MKRRFFYDCEFIERPCTIDLISIGVVGEDGSEFYAVSSEFDANAAVPWVRENVFPYLPPEAERESRASIRARLLDFLKPSKADPLELWAYYGAYDHVTLCWIFGSMVELPEGMPKHTHDLKQWANALGNPRFPKDPENEHHALADARWNVTVWQKLKQIEQGRTR